MPSKDFLALNPGIDPAALAIVSGKRGKKGTHPRAKPGEGDRVKDLMTLAARGWVRTNYQAGEYWMTHRDGHTTPRYATYRLMLDSTLKEGTQ